MGIATLLETIASAAPDRAAVGIGPEAMTFSELALRARRAAATFRDQHAQSVCYLGQSGPAFHVALFGAAAAGLPLTPLNYRLSPEQLDAQLAQRPRTVIVQDAQARGFLPQGRTVISATHLGVDGDEHQGDSGADDDAAIILFTSGTTAEPKGVVLRHSNLTAYVLQTVDFLSAEESDATLVSVPPYHVAGVGTVLTNTFAGRRVLHLPDFTPEEWLRLVRAEGVTSAMVVPTMLARVVEHLADARADTPSLRTIAYGGARMPRPVLERALAAFPDAGFVNAYGLTETSSTIALLGPEEHREALRSDDQGRLGSVGRFVPGVEGQIRDGEVVLPPGEAGELWVRGPQVSGEYLGSGDSRDADGWFPTHDRALIDHDGYLYVEGRTDDTIIRGGENIAPAEVEDVLLRHPSVVQAAVLGIPDDEWGQRIAAFVVLTESATVSGEELKEFVRGRLRTSRTPDVIHFRPDLPTTPTGKLLRRELASSLAGVSG